MKKNGLSIIKLLLFIMISAAMEVSANENNSNILSANYHTVWMGLDAMDNGKEVVKDEDLSNYHIVRIQNQNDFDELSSIIKRNIAEGHHNILIDFKRARYEYSENHINLSISNPKVNLIFKGNGSELIGKPVKNNDRKNPAYAYSKNGKPIDLWSETIELDEAVSPTDKPDIYKIKMPKVKANVGDFIKISQWYLSSVYEITDVKDGYLYFSTDYPYEVNVKGRNVNSDLDYGKVFPRCRIFHSISDNSISEHHPICFLRISKSKINSFKLSGFSFSYSALSKYGIIFLNNLDSQNTTVEDCRFSDCKSLCIQLNSTKNVTVENCSFIDNFNECIKANDGCYGTSIVNNYFKNNGKEWNNYFDITVSGEKFLIAHNVIVNFSYGGIRVGNWWGNSKGRRIEGYVEYNELYYTPDFYASYKQHTLMDSGAIYVATVNDNVHVRYNRIYDIAGAYDNKGIFCDDGTCNTKIYGNIVTGIKNSYSIDLRYTPNVEKDEKYKFGKVNVGDVMMYNIVDGDIRFEGRDKENECIKGMNYLLNKDGHQTPKEHIKNIEKPENDVFLIQTGEKNGRIALSGSDKNKLKKNPIFEKIKNWIK